MPTTEEFRAELARRFIEAHAKGQQYLEVNAGELHKSLGGNQQYPPCCNAMHHYYTEKSDQITKTSPSGKSPSLTIRYQLPKEKPLLKRSRNSENHPERQKTRSRRGISAIEGRIDHLIESFDECLDFFDQANVFTGPCVYFHEKTIRIRNSYDTVASVMNDDAFFDFLYATLTSWGMNKLGRGGPKLRNLFEIKESFLDQIDRIAALENLSIISLAQDDLERVTDQVSSIIFDLKIGAHQTKLVVGTKALHHLLPFLCPPIDKTYTHTFFFGTPNADRNEEELFKIMYRHFHDIAKKCSEIINRRLANGLYGMYTSPTKVIDNAIVGYVKKHLNEKKQ
jgi:hypothetical protein